MSTLNRLTYELLLVIGPCVLHCGQALLTACSRFTLQLLACCDRPRLIEQLACCVGSGDSELDRLLTDTIAAISDDGIPSEDLLEILLDAEEFLP